MSRRSIGRWIVGGAIAVSGANSGSALAQSSTVLIEPSIPLDYDRGRNVGVVERARPDFDPLGLRRGGFLIFPRVEFGLGATDNVFLSPTDRRSDAFAVVAPSLRVTSDWSRHQLLVSGGGRFRRYFSNGLRDQDEYYLNGLGRLDVGTSYSLTAEGQLARVQEEPFSGETDSTVAALSRYRRNLLALRGEYREGRVRAILSYSNQNFTFSDVRRTNGIAFSQANRDRRIDRFAGQLEYAFSPSAAAYGQLEYQHTRYKTLLAPGIVNRDSNGFRALGGLSLDASGLYRGIVGIGYTRRNYRSPIYRDIGGFSAEARLEYFPSELTTFTLNLRRVIEDSNLGNSSAFFDNRASLRVDHELRRNLLLNAGVEYARETYSGVVERDNIWRLRGGARYMLSRSFEIEPNLSYARRHRFGGATNFTVSELSATISLVIQR